MELWNNGKKPRLVDGFPNIQHSNTLGFDKETWLSANPA
jgi:hypothetical protein